MLAIIQRVIRANVSVNQKIIAVIQQGMFSH
jgi:D-Tyr-tRNAtyr deacylase